MAEVESTPLVQTPPPHQLLVPHRNFLLHRPSRFETASIDWSRRSQLLRPVPAQLPTTGSARGGGRGG